MAEGIVRRRTIERLPRIALVALVACDVFWFLAYTVLAGAGQTGTKLFKVFDLNLEANPPTWFSSAQLLLVGIAMLMLAVPPLSREPRVRPVRRLFAAGAAVFIYLSAEEGGVIHERMSGLGHFWTWLPNVRGNVWVVVYGTLGVLALAFLWRPLAEAWRLWPRETKTAIAGLVLYLIGVVGLEFLSYGNETAWWFALDVGAEELLEMLGTSLILFAALEVQARTAVAMLAEDTAERATAA